ncbi:MAG: hypothetical protein AAB421_03270 [Patescibacteria group bacterium]
MIQSNLLHGTFIYQNLTKENHRFRGDFLLASASFRALPSLPSSLLPSFSLPYVSSALLCINFCRPLSMRVALHIIYHAEYIAME